MSHASASFRISARVPVSVSADDNTIFCNSTKGYRLILVSKDGSEKILEEVVMATKKPNPYKREEGESWKIIAL